MERKKWTPKAEITDSLLRSREKRKWQLALRRYVIEKNLCTNYAFYFGLSIEQFRNWIEIQFAEDLNWENFGSAWQFEHIIPLAYFDFSNDDDLRLCWNFINIRVEKIEQLLKEDYHHVDLIAARPYFEALYKRTGYSICLKMFAKIKQLEIYKIDESGIEEFIVKNKDQIEIFSSLSKDEFNGLNIGMSLPDILLEREIIKKFG